MAMPSPRRPILISCPCRAIDGTLHRSGCGTRKAMRRPRDRLALLASVGADPSSCSSPCSFPWSIGWARTRRRNCPRSRCSLVPDPEPPPPPPGPEQKPPPPKPCGAEAARAATAADYSAAGERRTSSINATTQSRRPPSRTRRQPRQSRRRPIHGAARRSAGSRGQPTAEAGEAANPRPPLPQPADRAGAARRRRCRRGGGARPESRCRRS